MHRLEKEVEWAEDRAERKGDAGRKNGAGGCGAGEGTKEQSQGFYSSSSSSSLSLSQSYKNNRSLKLLSLWHTQNIAVRLPIYICFAAADAGVGDCWD